MNEQQTVSQAWQTCSHIWVPMAKALAVVNFTVPLLEQCAVCDVYKWFDHFLVEQKEETK